MRQEKSAKHKISPVEQQYKQDRTNQNLLRKNKTNKKNPQKLYFKNKQARTNNEQR